MGETVAMSAWSAQAAEAELDRFIDCRSREKDRERDEEEGWKESTRRYNAAREAERRSEWCEYHRSQAERLRRMMEPLIAFHKARAQQLLEEGAS